MYPTCLTASRDSVSTGEPWTTSEGRGVRGAGPPCTQKFTYNLPVCVCLCVLSYLSWIQFCDPMGCSPPGSSVYGILQAKILEWVAMSSCRRSSWPRDQTHISYIFCIGRHIIYHWSHLGNPHVTFSWPLYLWFLSIRFNQPQFMQYCSIHCWKTSLGKWPCTVRTCVVQGSIVYFELKNKWMLFWEAKDRGRWIWWPFNSWYIAKSNAEF